MISKITIDRYHSPSGDIFQLSMKGSSTKEDKAIIEQIGVLVDLLSNSSDSSSKSNLPSPSQQHDSKQVNSRDSKYEI